MPRREVHTWALRGVALFAASLSMPGCLAGMPKEVKVFWTFAAIAAAVLAVVFTIARIVLAAQSRRRYERAVEQVETGHAEEALTAIRAGKKWELAPDRRERWDALEMSAYVQLRDPGRLLELFNESPKPFTTDEEAALIAARAQIETRRLEAFSDLRRVWVAREGKVDQWLGLESDLLVLQEQPDEAIVLLKRFKFEGAPEGRRLARLGHLLAEQDPPLAAKAIDLAAQKGPKLADVWLFTGRYHERAGRHQAAYAAFVRALECDPQDFFVRNHLAEFLVCQAAYTQALKLWAEAAVPPTMDFIWLKILFWQRVANGDAGGALIGACPPGPFRRLVEVLRKLPDNRFWSDELENFTHELGDLPEVAWLRLLESLRLAQDDEALSVLNLGLRSAHDVVEGALKQVLTYRRTGFFEPGAGILSERTPGPLRTPLFVRLDQWIAGALTEDPPDLVQQIETGEIVATVLRAAGWNEAAATIAAAR